MNHHLDRLLDEVEQLSPIEPARALDLADAALGRIQEGTFRTQARTFLLWGNLRRVFGCWSEAEDAFYLSARLYRQAGVLGADWLPWYLRVALLRRDQRRLTEAEQFVSRAVEICRHEPQPSPALGQALTYQGTVLAITDLARAACCARAALGLLGPHDLAHRRTAVHTVLAHLCYCDDSGEMGQWLHRAREFNDPPDSYAGLKVTWFEGLAHGRDGRYQAAVSALRTARAGILPHHGGVAAICAMDEALLHLEAGNSEAARSLAGQLFPIFQALRTSREATAALSVYASAAGRGALTGDLVRQIRRRIELAPIPPNLPQTAESTPNGAPATGLVIRL